MHLDSHLGAALLFLPGHGSSNREDGEVIDRPHRIHQYGVVMQGIMDEAADGHAEADPVQRQQ